MEANKKNNSGYTLLEMIITIAIIAIAISVTGFGLNTLFYSNVNSYSNKLVNELRLVQSKEMASKDNDYSVIIEYNGTHYIIKTEMQTPSTLTSQTYDLPSSASIRKEITVGTYTEVKDYYSTYPSTTEFTFTFEPVSGKELSGGAGKYQITSTQSNDIFKFEVVEPNGRVYIDE